MSDKHTSPATVQMNLTLPALNALLGEDPELRTKITHGVIENFAKQHFIKALQNDKDIARTLEDLKNRAKQDVLSAIGIANNTWASGGTLTIHDSHIVKIKEVIKSRADAYITQCLEEQLSNIEKLIETAVAKRIDSTINSAVRARLQLVEANIRELSEALPVVRTPSGK